MALNKREMKYLSPGILHDWKIQSWPGRTRGRLNFFWNGDSQLKVGVGEMTQNLVKRGYLDRFIEPYGEWYRVTSKAKAYQCSECHGMGSTFDLNDNETGKCPHCSGAGVKQP